VVKPRFPILSISAALIVSLFALPAVADDLDSAVASARGGSLPIHSQAESLAAASARAQANAGKPFHSDLSPIMDSCKSAGEVVGMGPNVQMIFDEFAKSGVHWTVITSSNWRSMGTAQSRGSDGYLYISVIFCNGDAPTRAAPPTTPTTVAASPIVQPASRAVRASLKIVPFDRELCPLITGEDVYVDMSDAFCII
jgi:hypothetical protein